MTDELPPPCECEYPSVCYRCGKALPHLPNGEPDYDISATPSIPQHDDEVIICRECYLAGPRRPHDFEIGDRVLIEGQEYIVRDRDDIDWGASGTIDVSPADAPDVIWSFHRDRIQRILGRTE